MTKTEKIFADLVDQSLIDARYLIGCSSDEISSIERQCETVLPMEYLDFLNIAGRGAGRLFVGTEIFYPNILSLPDAAAELLEELGIPDFLPKNAFVFSMHQGYEIEYFMCNETDDPEVFQLFEKSAGYGTYTCKTFSHFLTSEIENHLRSWPNLNPN
jgi:hypothetical protein